MEFFWIFHLEKIKKSRKIPGEDAIFQCPRLKRRGYIFCALPIFMDF